jgi:alpha-amylase
MNPKRTMCAILAASMLTTGVVLTQSTATASAQTTATPVSAASTENMPVSGSGNIADGNILHCFDWTFNDIKAELPNIAAAGFTSVQTSPIQGQSDPGAWYWLYQPTHLNLQANSLGGRDELASLCAEADKYGIKVIVDVVFNHLAGAHEKIDPAFTDSQYWHNSGLNSENNNVDWTNRWQITHCDLGMPDLNSEHEVIQQKALAYANDLKSIGVDGIRWDAAKHIGLPSEDTHFWDTVSGCGLWMYGEILDGPLSFKEEDQGQVQHAASLMNEYTKYISVTDSKYGDVVTGTLTGGNVPEGYGVWSARNVSDAKLVYWAESHDTYSNKKGWTKNVDQNVIDRSYAIVASRKNTPALYLSRPFAKGENDIQGGQKGSTHYADKEVSEINKFKNANLGKADYYATSNGCAVITRQGGGAVLVKASGSGHVDVPNGGKYAKPGTYTDHVSGNTFTVTADTISGDIGNTGIAVLYEGGGTIDTSTDTSTNQNTDTGTVVPGGSVNIYFDNSSYNWSSVYCYIYTDTGENAKWPGVKMEKDSATGLYKLNADAFKNGNAMFSDGNNDAGKRYPADQQPGLPIGGKSKIFGASNSWSDTDDNKQTESDKPSETDTSTETTTDTGTSTDTATSTETDTATQVDVLMGDANQDGKVSLRDASLVLKAAVKKTELTGAAFAAGDVDSNGQITAADSLAIQRYDIGYPSDTIGTKVKKAV